MNLNHLATMLWKDQVKQETADIYIRELYKQQ